MMADVSAGAWESAKATIRQMGKDIMQDVADALILHPPFMTIRPLYFLHVRLQQQSSRP